MRSRLWFSALLLAGLTAPVFAQSVDDAKQAFQKSLEKQRFIPRGFSGDAVTQYSWTDQALDMRKPSFHEFGVFLVDSVSYKKKLIEIEGTLGVLVKTEGGALALSGGKPAKLRIAFGDADLATVLPQLKQKLFYATTDEALADVSKEYRKNVPFTPRAVSGENPDSTKPINVCTDLFPGAKFTPPKALSTADPAYSQEAREHKFSGSIMVGVVVDNTGHINDPWALTSLKFGLDEKAIEAVKQYKFKPAYCDANPVPMTLTIEVDFQIF